MKRFAYVGAIALLSVLGFSACSSNDDALVDNNPTYNPQTGEVNVNFVFNVSTSNEPNMRMTSANTQATSLDAFRGINNAYLAVVKKDADGEHVTSADTDVEKLHSLGTVINAGGLTPNDAADNVADSRRIVELSLPTGANTLMFWGKAIKTGNASEQGKVTMQVSENLSDISIKMNKIVPETADPTEPHVFEASLLQHEKLMAAALTNIINAHLEAKLVSFGGESRTVTLAWSDYVSVTGDKSSGYTLAKKTDSPTKGAGNVDVPMSPLGEKLSLAFVTLNTIQPSELRAGYGEAVSHMIRDLMAIINSTANADPTSINEAVSKAMAERIKVVVEQYFDNDQDYIWKSASTIKGLFSSASDEYTLVDDGCDLNKFPTTFNLPLGSVILDFTIAQKDEEDPTKGFQFRYDYKGTVETYAMGGSTTASDAFNPLNYVYPAELCYFGNSPIRVSDNAKTAINYPDGAGNWETDGKWDGDWVKDGRVQSTTRSVAMQNNINYGTALLETKIKYGAAVLEDNNKALQKRWTGADEENNQILVNDGIDNHFVLTGVLIGGQEPEVGWNYLAKSTAPGFGYMVYDKVDNLLIPAYNAAASEQSPSFPNYSLVWDNWQNTSDDNARQRIVYVALEFKNNSQDFYGENNLIRNGATFYIVGKLDPDAKPASYTGSQEAYVADQSAGITWPTNYALPPYDSEGKTLKKRRVFIQDFKTTATFVLGEKSLQSALVSVPDLRSGQISLGLSVNLEWQTGLNFGDVVLGNTSTVSGD